MTNYSESLADLALEPRTALSVRSPDTDGLANDRAAKELVARSGGDSPIPPVPVLAYFALAFYNIGRMFITAMQEQHFANPGTLSPLNTQVAGATLLNNRIATAVAAGTSEELSVRLIPIVQTTPFVIAITLNPAVGMTWAQIAQNAGGLVNLQLTVTQAVQRVITGNIESATYQLNLLAQNHPPGVALVGFGVGTMNVQIEDHSVLEH
ncbi:hypothetical protein GP486_002466 [Trichoglossum hirsutum]|uniref:Uncharacterized protein n=1 Tax=Trichoglossum hirsutum TaxID=265104 RepID=A0A9P8LF61_9PEZI|nr:hypothetical protein GP486_002466 [Trichoglossum hirsutum]